MSKTVILVLTYSYSRCKYPYNTNTKNNKVLKVRKQINHELRAIGKELKIKTKLTSYMLYATHSQQF